MMKNRLYHLPSSRMYWRFSFALLLFACISLSGIGAGVPTQLVKPDDSIVFMGDSITVASASPDGFATLIVESLKKSLPGGNVKINVAACGEELAGMIFPELANEHEGRQLYHEKQHICNRLDMNEMPLI